MAMRARVMALRGFYGQSGSMSVERYNSEINDMVNSFSLIKTPRHLKGVEDTLISAVRDQQVFFNEWAKSKGTRYYEHWKRNYSAHPKVQSSHKKLLQAYYKLMAMYPREVQHNKTAFFDHLCALDFSQLDVAEEVLDRLLNHNPNLGELLMHQCEVRASHHDRSD